MSENSTITRPLYDAINATPYCVAIRVHCGEGRFRGGYIQLEPSGTPDILALLRRASDEPIPPTWFETKAVDGKLNDAQVAAHARLRAFGHRVEVPRSFPEAMATLREILEARR